MSRFDSPRELADEIFGEPLPTSDARDVMLRTIGAMLLLGIAVIHFAQIAETFRGTLLLGAAYLVVVAACLVVAGRLITHGDRPAWVGAGLIGAAAIAGYSFTRLVNTPLDHQDVGNWSCMLGLAALLVEASLLMFSGYAVSLGRPSRGRAVPGSVAFEAASRRAAA